MYIFVDESGVFKRNEEAKHSISCVAALVIPGRYLTVINDKFRKLTKDWPRDTTGEIKGRLLSEDHLYKLCVLLEPYHVLLNICSFDMNMSSSAELDAHQQGQADGLVAMLTDQHHPNFVKGVYEDKSRLEKMPRQLYAQSVAMTDAIWNVFELGMGYYCQRLPGELASFAWRIDAKGPEGVTSYEDWWHLNVKGLIQSKSIREPTAVLKGGDYSAFRRNFPKMHTPDFLKKHIPEDRHKDVMDLNPLPKDIKFADSQSLIGLQIVDILANGFRRALSGRMKRTGWIGLEKLLIHKKKGAIVMRTFGQAQSTKTDYSSVVNELNLGGRYMLKRA